MKTISITQKELDKKIGEERQKSYELGVLHGRSEWMPFRKNEAVKAVILIDALTNFLDERYEFKKREY